MMVVHLGLEVPSGTIVGPFFSEQTYGVKPGFLHIVLPLKHRIRHGVAVVFLYFPLNQFIEVMVFEYLSKSNQRLGE